MDSPGLKEQTTGHPATARPAFSKEEVLFSRQTPLSEDAFAELTALFQQPTTDGSNGQRPTAEVPSYFMQLAARNVTEQTVEALLDRLEKNAGIDNLLTDYDLFTLLHPLATAKIERLARIARRYTRMRFGNNVQLYAPLYLSNECLASCSYCGFSFENKVDRLTLSLQQLEDECRQLAATGIRHVLLLTGEDRLHTPVEYIARAVETAKRFFPSVSLEIYPLFTEEYRLLVENGAEGLTLYQETYDRLTYSRVHRGGKKRNYDWRLGGIERAARSGMRRLGIGALLGLADFRSEVFLLALHGRFLNRRFGESQTAISLPRLRPASGVSAADIIEVSDRNLAQMYFALRIFLPDTTLVVSTRESAAFRAHMAAVCINQISAGSKTEPGGYSDSGALEQFSIDDNRPPAEVADSLRGMGLNPVWKDWDTSLL